MKSYLGEQDIQALADKNTTSYGYPKPRDLGLVNTCNILLTRHHIAILLLYSTQGGFSITIHSEFCTPLRS